MAQTTPIDSLSREALAPAVYIPNYSCVRHDSASRGLGGCMPICLDRGDLWDRQSGEIIKPDTAFHCVRIRGRPGECLTVDRLRVHPSDCAQSPSSIIKRAGIRWAAITIVDREVKNGFNYFYSVTAFDSTSELGQPRRELGRPRAVGGGGGRGHAAGRRLGEARARCGSVPESVHVATQRSPQRPLGLGSRLRTPRDPDRNAHRLHGAAGRASGRSRSTPVSGDLVQELQSRRSGERVDSRSPVDRHRSHGQLIMAPGYNRQQDNAERRAGPLEPDLAERAGHRERDLHLHRRVESGR